MDWISTVVGAVIAFVSSAGIVMLQMYINRKGSIDFYAKVVYSPASNGSTWGFNNNQSGIILTVPIWFEIQNTSNVSRIIRDLNLVLVDKGKEIATMKQCNSMRKSALDESEFANAGSYSLSIGARDIKRIECFFAFVKDSNISNFDEIKMCYYDEKDKEHKLSLGHVNGDWTIRQFEYTGEWIKLKEE